MSKSSRKSRPTKPRPDFPLFPHRTNRWCKKVRGQFVYFGKVDIDPKGEAALERWLDQKDDLLAGRKPRGKVDALSVEQLANAFLGAKKARVISGELAQRTWADYQQLLVLVVETLGRNRAAADIQPADWAKLRTVFASKWGPWRLANATVYTKGCWKWGWENGHLATPMRFGSGFARPNAKTMRAVKNANGDRTFQPEQVHAILSVGSPNMKAALLLGLNCGYGTGDIAGLPLSALDLQAGWAEFPRPKTAIRRRCPLWAGTVEAVKAVLASRPIPRPGNETLVFLRSGPKSNGTTYRGNGSAQVAVEFAQTCKAAGVTGHTFYDARRSFQTQAESSKDFPAVSAIMGHVASGQDMASIYRQRVSDERLQAVVDVVHGWLFASVDDDTANGMGGGI
ncbi:MAG: hypothetical protein NTY19_23840 [Planctomycetota bacterium]|nr:hypothetical protein [Planctomycetota bacterium]